MIETRIRPVSTRRAPDDLPPGPARRESLGRRWRLRLWTLLNAQALIQGTAGGPGDIAFAEDDRQRLARRGHE